MKRLTKLGMVLLAASVAAPVFAQSGGEATYKAKCAMCHGADGMANSPVGKSMKVPPAKDFASASEAELIAITKNGKGKMPAYNGKLTDAQIHDVVAYLHALGKK